MNKIYTVFRFYYNTNTGDIVIRTSVPYINGIPRCSVQEEMSQDLRFNSFDKSILGCKELTSEEYRQIITRGTPAQIDLETMEISYEPYAEGEALYMPGTSDYNLIMSQMKQSRNELLQEADHVILRHMEQMELVESNLLDKTSITHDQYIEALKYKQELRDMFNIPNFNPNTALYPIKPGCIK